MNEPRLYNVPEPRERAKGILYKRCSAMSQSDETTTL